MRCSDAAIAQPMLALRFEDIDRKDGARRVAKPIQLPSMPRGLTADWLTGALRQAGFLPGGVRIGKVAREQIGDGAGMMSELARLRLAYEGNGAQLTGTIVAKFPSRNPTNREIAMAYNLYEREVRYFAELDSRTTAYSPKTFVSAIQGDNFLILMEDMADYRVGDQVAGADLADTQAMIDELAKLHAAFWNQVDDLAWVPHIANSYHAANMGVLAKVGWPNMVKIFADHIDSAIAAKGDAFLAALPRLQGAMDAGPITLLHGDFRMENVFFGTARQHQPVAIIDWQGPLLGKGVVDVALMLGQSTQVEVRRAQQRGLVERYARQLKALGVEDYGVARAWDDCQLALLYNWVYVAVVAGALDASNERAFAWMSQMVARQSAVTLDLDLFRLLP